MSVLCELEAEVEFGVPLLSVAVCDPFDDKAVVVFSVDDLIESDVVWSEVVEKAVVVVVCSVGDTVKGCPSGRLVSMTSVVGMLEPPRLERTSEGTMDMGRGVAKNVVAVVVTM